MTKLEALVALTLANELIEELREELRLAQARVQELEIVVDELSNELTIVEDALEMAQTM